MYVLWSYYVCISGLDPRTPTYRQEDTVLAILAHSRIFPVALAPWFRHNLGELRKFKAN